MQIDDDDDDAWPQPPELQEKELMLMQQYVIELEMMLTVMNGKWHVEDTRYTKELLKEVEDFGFSVSLLISEVQNQIQSDNSHWAQQAFLVKLEAVLKHYNELNTIFKNVQGTRKRLRREASGAEPQEEPQEETQIQDDSQVE